MIFVFIEKNKQRKQRMKVTFKGLVAIMGITMVSHVFAQDNESEPKVKTAVPPSAITCQTEDMLGLSLSADFTLWTARQSGMDVAITNINAAGTNVSTSEHGHVIYPKFKLRPGFKVDLGYNFDHDGWEAVVEYTWFYNKTNHLHPTIITNGGMTTWSVPRGVSFSTTTIYSVHTKWDNWFNKVTAEIARSFFAGHYFSYRPFMGVLGAWEDQRFDIKYYQLASSSTPYQVLNKQEWWCVGPYGGVDSSFYFPGGEWAIFMDCGSALGWARCDAHQRNINTTPITCSFYKDPEWNLSPMIELAIGLKWDYCCSDNTWFVRMQAGWETQAWFNHNFMRSLGPRTSTGNGLYSMQGLTVKVLVMF